MKTITTNNRTLLFVEVPQDAEGFIVGFTAMCWDLGKPTVGIAYFPVSHNTYRLIATTDTITLIDKVRILGGKDPNHDWDKYFQSFLDNHSITGRHAIIEVL